MASARRRDCFSHSFAACGAGYAGDRGSSCPFLRRVTWKFDNHIFDLVVRNGRLISAMNTISFGTPDLPRLSREIDATAWILDDVRKKHRRLPLYVFAIDQQKAAANTVQKAKKIFTGLDAKFITENHLVPWAREQVDAITD